MTILTQYRAADLGLKGHRVVLAAIIANDLKPCRTVFAQCRLLRTAFWAPLRRHHIALVKLLLLFLGKEKDLAALNTRYFGIGHVGTP